MIIISALELRIDNSTKYLIINVNTVPKTINDIIPPILQIIFQASLNTGRVPADWITALVMPIFKKGSCTPPSNYQPVYLSPVLLQRYLNA